MGTWDTGPFDNDTAADFANALDDAEPEAREALIRMVSLVVVYGISGRECAGVCPGRTPTGEYRSLNRRRAIA
jgi:Domain of unknown function (DUF4259)